MKRSTPSALLKAISILALLTISAILIYQIFLSNSATKTIPDELVNELAATSLSLIDQDIELARLLSIEAFQMKVTTQTQVALYESWVLNQEPVRLSPGSHRGFSSVAWSPDGRLASGHWDGAILIWDLENNQPTQTLTVDSGFVSSVAWSPEGHLAAGYQDGTIIIWDLESSQPAQTLNGHQFSIEQLAWSPDGRLASISFGKIVVIWDFRSGLNAKVLFGHTYETSAIAWSPDGRLASGACLGFDEVEYDCNGGEIIIWDIENEQAAQTLEGHPGWVTSLAWSPENQLASSSYADIVNETLILWDLESGQANPLKGPRGDVLSIAWSPDGRLASTHPEDGIILIWNLESDQPTQTLIGDPNYFTQVAWSVNSQLATGSDDAVTVWEMDPAVWLQQNCQLVTRKITAAEWDQYLSWKGPYHPEYNTCLH